MARRADARLLAATTAVLVDTVADFLRRGLPLRRTLKLAGLLKFIGPSQDAPWLHEVAHASVRQQKDDGGWVDCEDTAWALWVLDGLADMRPSRGRGVSWLRSERSGAGWGFCRRDEASIPMTATLAWLVPELCDASSATWLREAWSRELESPVRLTYKGAYYLLGSGWDEQERALRARTCEYLVGEQRPDGGWGPWREHPAASDCFSTGICALALSGVPEDPDLRCALAAACRWFARNRLPNGWFPTHFIEEGTAWAAAGWSAAVKRLSGEA